MLCLLGKSGLLVDDCVMDLAMRPKALALVAYLALAERPRVRREVARSLFPEAEEPLGVLRWHLSYLRSTAPSSIADRLSATREHVALCVPTDVVTFRQHIGRVHEAPEAADAPNILALYRGDLLDGLAVSTAADFDLWLCVERQALQRAFRQATVSFARWALRHGQAAATLAPLSRLVSVDPYSEDGHALLIDAYEAQGAHDSAASARARYERIVRRDGPLTSRSTSAPRCDTTRRASSAVQS